MAKANTLDMTQGPLTKKLFAFAVPMIFTLVLQQFYNLADRAVVGQFAANGKDALAAIGATGSITSLILNMTNGVGSGANVRCSNLRGAGDAVGLRKSMHTTVLLSLWAGVILAVLGILITDPLLRSLDTPEEIMGDSALYLRIYFAGLPATVIYNFGAAILRSHGDTKRPMYILMLSGVVNVALNIVLVVVFKMRVAGVAIATIVAQTISAFRVVRILFNPKDEYKLSFKELRFHGESAKVILRIGIPNGINGLLFSFSNLIVQSSINSFKDTAIIAGKTAANDVCNLIYQVIHAYALACVSASGQCYGAKKYKRMDKLAATAILCCNSIVIVLCGLLSIIPGWFISLFNNSPDVIAAGTPLLLLMAWSYVIYTFSDIFLSCSRGAGKSMSITVMNVIGIIAPRLIWIWFVFPMHRTMPFLYLCYPVSYVISSLAQAIYYINLRKKLDKKAALEVAAE